MAGEAEHRKKQGRSKRGTAEVMTVVARELVG